MSQDQWAEGHAEINIAAAVDGLDTGTGSGLHENRFATDSPQGADR
jgi:hypothetical protein